MRKRTLCATILAASVLSPVTQAQTTWVFEYAGFERNGVFDPDLKVGGAFTGSDIDGDDVIEQDEISRFSWDGFYTELADAGFCLGSLYCNVTDFRYRLDGQLDFRFDWRYIGMGSYSGGEVVVGNYIDSAGYVVDGDSSGRTWRWTDQTRFSISPPPVPEPGQYALLAAGLCAVAALRRRSWLLSVLRRPLRASPSPRPAAGIRPLPWPPHRSPRGA